MHFSSSQCSLFLDKQNPIERQNTPLEPQFNHQIKCCIHTNNFVISHCQRQSYYCSMALVRHIEWSTRPHVRKKRIVSIFDGFSWVFTEIRFRKNNPKICKKIRKNQLLNRFSSQIYFKGTRHFSVRIQKLMLQILFIFACLPLMFILPHLCIWTFSFRNFKIVEIRHSLGILHVIFHKYEPLAKQATDCTEHRKYVYTQLLLLRKQCSFVFCMCDMCVCVAYFLPWYNRVIQLWYWFACYFPGCILLPHTPIAHIIIA